MTILRRIAQGELITAEFLNASVDQVNELTGIIKGPEQVDSGIQPEPIPGEEDYADEVAGTELWQEISRIADVVRVSNPDDPEQYVDVSRILSVTFQKPDGSRVQLAFESSLTAT